MNGVNPSKQCSCSSVKLVKSRSKWLHAFCARCNVRHAALLRSSPSIITCFFSSALFRFSTIMTKVSPRYSPLSEGRLTMLSLHCLHLHDVLYIRTSIPNFEVNGEKPARWSHKVTHSRSKRQCDSKISRSYADHT